jgi:para-nitrobenzyl esterase
LNTAPPVGALRWKAPAPARPWKGVRDAAAPGAACAQVSRTGATGSEDCLYLNVWASEWPARGRRPVMLWFFGGANVTGSANNPVFDGAALAKQGVVVVTMNHRVGALGFLAHPALSAESGHNSSGNYTLLDQIAALRWIKANIAKFGGDPNHVTLFGQSSGSFDILLLMTSPLAKGLFVNAIAESGQFLSYDGPMPKARAEKIGTEIAASLGAPAGPGALAHLRALPADQVMTAAMKLLPTEPGTDTGLLTNIDGYVLAESPAKLFASGRQARVSLLIGNNSREISPQTTPDEWRRQILARYGDAFGARALEAYGLANGGAGASDPLLGNAGAQWMTDIVQRCAATLETQWHAASGAPTWQYQFERSIPGREAVGSTHGAEVAFVFGTLDRVNDKPPFTAADAKASAQIQEYWTRFAKTGDPNGGALPPWPRAGDGRYLAFTAEGPVTKQNLQAGPCGVYRDWAVPHFTR